MLWSMERKDFRRIGRDAQEALRERAVYLVLREAKTQAEAAGLAGGHRQVVNRWSCGIAIKARRGSAMDAGFPRARAAGF